MRGAHPLKGKLIGGCRYVRNPWSHGKSRPAQRLENCASADCRCSAIVRDPGKAADFAAMGCEIAIADLRDAATLAKAIAGAKAVQAICPAVQQAEDTASDMRGMIDAIARALIAAKTEKVVAISDYGAERTRERASPSPSIISRRDCAKRRRN